MKEISSGLNDAANFSPLGPWTETTMDVSALEATATTTTTKASTASKQQATDYVVATYLEGE